ncbi:MAG: VCBS repeat-containing protein [Planctomycetes bacterium]|nr:VCBS repeat-containing protein [Planctomycetota bacterium]
MPRYLPKALLAHALSMVTATVVALPTIAQSTQFEQLTRLSWPSNTDQASHIDAADIDLDGFPDVVVARSTGSQAIQLLKNDGLGNFTDVTSTNIPTLSSARCWNVAFARLDRDPWPDIVISGYGQTIVLLNTRIGGKFKDVTATNVPITTGNMYGLAVGDVDGDGDTDIVLGNSSTSANALLINDGFGKFSSAQFPATTGANVWGVALVDVDGDKDLDALLASSGAANTQGLYINDGKGVFKDESLTRLPSIAGSCREIIPLDADGDGDMDAYFAMYGSQDLLLINDGTGKFSDQTAARLPALSTGSYGGTAADVDEDGDTDVLIGNWSSTRNVTIHLYENNGNGIFTNATSRVPSTPVNALDLVAVDIDGDQDLDFPFAHWGARDGIYTNLEGQIHSANAPAIGTTWTLDAYARPGYASLPQGGTFFLGIGPLTPPVFTPWGRLGILPPLFVGPGFSLPPPGGKRSIQLPIPNNVNLRGLQLWWQAMHIHPPIDIRLTNVWTETVQ